MGENALDLHCISDMDDASLARLILIATYEQQRRTDAAKGA